MSHRKIHSQGNVPFSWEDKPGVSKVNHFDEKFSVDVGLNDDDGGSAKILVVDKKVPPPPPCSLQPPKRSTSFKGLRWWQEDPFLAAYKECTKSGGNGKLLSSEAGKNGGSKLGKKKKITFSCKDSCDVTDNNLVRLSNLPPLPKYRIRMIRQEFV